MRSLLFLFIASALSATVFADKRFMPLVPDDELTEIRLDSHTEVVIDDNKEPTTAATMERNQLDQASTPRELNNTPAPAVAPTPPVAPPMVTISPRP
ncbi:hypothetical protein [Thalassolituus sp.]|uniref:hypothetical protein n=1 Tax=Thalassolituus sp. TaxID=2030822 RepID=UPI002A814C8B|nr:hypothetical protein [Thalassolituus sp.]